MNETAEVLTPSYGEKPFWGIGELLSLSWPASLTMLNATLIRFVDGLMVSRVGHEPFSAQLVAGMWAFVIESFMVGMLTVVNTYVSQNFGAGRFRRTGRYAWAGLFLAWGFAIVFAPLVLAARPLFTLLSPESETIIALEILYFRYMILSIGLTLSAHVLGQFFYGIHRPRIVLAASIIANAVNVAVNYVLIFGKFGLPAMGLEGAAIGSVISWVVQVVLLMAVFFSPDMRRRFSTFSLRGLRLRYIGQLISIGWPAGVQLFSDIFSWIVFISVLVGRVFGQAHLTASTVVMRYIGLSFMPALGIGIATTVLVGRYIGAGRPDLARKRAHAGVLAAMAYMGLCGLIFFIFRYPLVSFLVKGPSAGAPVAQAQIAQEIVRIGTQIMICAAVFQLFDAVGIVFIGALRGAGDTRWPMLITIVLSWGLIILGGSALALLAPALGSVGPWIAASIYVIVLSLLVTWRFESGAWRQIDLLGRGEKRLPTPPARPRPASDDIAVPFPPLPEAIDPEKRPTSGD